MATRSSSLRGTDLWLVRSSLRAERSDSTASGDRLLRGGRDHCFGLGEKIGHDVADDDSELTFVAEGLDGDRAVTLFDDEGDECLPQCPARPPNPPIALAAAS